MACFWQICVCEKCFSPTKRYQIFMNTCDVNILRKSAVHLVVCLVCHNEINLTELFQTSAPYELSSNAVKTEKEIEITHLPQSLL